MVFHTLTFQFPHFHVGFWSKVFIMKGVLTTSQPISCSVKITNLDVNVSHLGPSQILS